MKKINIEDYYLTTDEAAEFLGVSKGRIPHLANSGQIKRLKGAVYDKASVEYYLAKRGDKKGGRYPTNPITN